MNLSNRTESGSHSRAKHALAALIGAHDHLIAHHETEDGYQSVRFDIAGCDPVIECAYPSGLPCPDPDEYYADHRVWPDMIFDIGLIRDGAIVGAIEIMRSCWIDQRKDAKLRASPIWCIGVTDKMDLWYTGGNRLDARYLRVPSGKTGARLIAPCEVA